jgi:hydroxyquinol 1,2-dioxygenase
MVNSDFDEHSITQAVLDRFANTPDARLKRIIQSLVRHAHDFIRDVELTEEEWLAGIQFLTAAGHITDDKRQEFILLSDTLGISMLVDAINHRLPQGATETTVLGPFYVTPPAFDNGADIAKGQPGTPLFVSGRVESSAGAPLADAQVDVWQSDDEGYYDVQKSDDLSLRARLRADGEGHFSFWTIVPKFYPIPHDGPVGQMLVATKRHPYRPAHVHFMISSQGYEMLVTHLFVEGDRYLDSDAVFGVKESLIVSLVDHDAGSAAPGGVVTGPWKSLDHTFGLKPAAGSKATR